MTTVQLLVAHFKLRAKESETMARLWATNLEEFGVTPEDIRALEAESETWSRAAEFVADVLSEEG